MRGYGKWHLLRVSAPLQPTCPATTDNGARNASTSTIRRIGSGASKCASKAPGNRDSSSGGMKRARAARHQGDIARDRHVTGAAPKAHPTDLDRITWHQMNQKKYQTQHAKNYYKGTGQTGNHLLQTKAPVNGFFALCLFPGLSTTV